MTLNSQLKLRYSDAETLSRSKTQTFWSVVVTDKDGNERLVSDFEPNVIPSAFVDKLHKMAFTDTSASEVGFNYIALTADTTQTLNASITSLTGEISTNGLGRTLAGTRTHTGGTNSTLIEHTFTLSGSQSDITRAALFNASSTGTIGPAAAFSNGATGAMVSGETVKVSITITTS